jgi:hypothetical protein
LGDDVNACNALVTSCLPLLHARRWSHAVCTTTHIRLRLLRSLSGLRHCPRLLRLCICQSVFKAGHTTTQRPNLSLSSLQCLSITTMLATA